MQIDRSALLPFSAHDMYRLVLDVPAYPQFLSWCRDSEVHEQDEGQQLASLWIKVGGMTQQFTTRNRLVPGEVLTMSLVEGPFRRLSGEWQFRNLGDSGSKVSLHLSFEFSNSLLSSAFRRGFERISERMVSEFARRAESLYG
ncbi:MAG: type II toxin-antitoxin system RatA family toxin [Xanthomonadales bacterium]|nr:type II toxin-antitoxin system RatA family toxin [Xanthomonadales bacterium]